MSDRWLQHPRNLALSVTAANLLGAMSYVALRSLALVRAERDLTGVTPEPVLSGQAHRVLILFLVINLAWAIAMLVNPRWRRWDLYAFVWGLWLVAGVLGSGLASI